MKTKTLFVVCAILLLLCIPTIIQAANTEGTSTSTINGVTANWSYEINEEGKIENLKCTNASELTGNITVPSTLNDKTVISVGDSGFASATGITGVTIPSTIKEIHMNAFSRCTNLTKVDLGNVELLETNAFGNCTALTSIKLPKTLKRGAGGAPFAGCTNLKNITLEEGMTVVPMYACAKTPIVEITIPSTVKEIEIWAFSGCNNLAKVNLGNVELLAANAFGNCTALTSIKLPKTLKRGAGGAPFVGCTNLKNITLEEGMTVVPMYACAKTPITEITIPSTVKEIEIWAFSECTNLTKVNLGNVENIAGLAFKNCTALTSIKIPKTLKQVSAYPPFSGCTNLKNITLEEGMTVIPSYLCAETAITEVTIPTTVTKIEVSAFKSCSSLKKITILDNVTEMVGYSSSSTDLIFNGHNSDLTIYCYKSSMADQYAKKYNIKTSYLTKPSNGNSGSQNNNTGTNNGSGASSTGTNKPTNGNTNNKDNTTASGKLPQTGSYQIAIIGCIIMIIIGSVVFVKYKKLKDI